MSEANMVATTKQLIVSIVIVGVMLATADQVGRNFLLANINTRIDSVEARIDAVERNLNARIDSLEKNFEARFARIEEDIRELRRGQEALNQRFSALTERVARIEEKVARIEDRVVRIEGFLFDSAEKLARAEQAPLKPDADRVQVAP